MSSEMSIKDRNFLHSIDDQLMVGEQELKHLEAIAESIYAELRTIDIPQDQIKEWLPVLHYHSYPGFRM